jgi:hypothetical protein
MPIEDTREFWDFRLAKVSPARTNPIPADAVAQPTLTEEEHLTSPGTGPSLRRIPVPILGARPYLHKALCRHGQISACDLAAAQRLNYDSNPNAEYSDQPLWNVAVATEASLVATLPYFSTTRFREIVPDPVCGGGPLQVARPFILTRFLVLYFLA